MKFGATDPNSTALYRMDTAASAPLVLRRKRCGCGAVVTAKQLTQFGACVACSAALEQRRAQQTVF